MKPLALILAILFSLPMICLAIRAAALHWRANRKPRNYLTPGVPVFRYIEAACKECQSLDEFREDLFCGNRVQGWCDRCDGERTFAKTSTGVINRRAEHRTRREIMRKIIERGSVK